MRRCYVDGGQFVAGDKVRSACIRVCGAAMWVGMLNGEIAAQKALPSCAGLLCGLGWATRTAFSSRAARCAALLCGMGWCETSRARGEGYPCTRACSVRRGSRREALRDRASRGSGRYHLTSRYRLRARYLWTGIGVLADDSRLREHPFRCAALLCGPGSLV